MTVEMYRKRLVGRNQEIARLHHLLQDLERYVTPAGPHATRSRVFPRSMGEQDAVHGVILQGAEGIGKTRLAEEVAYKARQRGWDVLWVRVCPQGEEIPYQLWTLVLHITRAQGLWQLQEVTRHPHLYQPLGTLLPELRYFLPGTHEWGDAAAQEQGRLWEAIQALLRAICTSKPLLLVLDDLHGATLRSCALLAFLLRQMRGLPILFLGLCRDSNLLDRHPLRDLFANLQRDQDLMLLTLAPLSNRAICQLADHLPVDQAQRIALAVAGNPFLATALVRQGSASLARLPDTIQAVFDRCLARTSQPCQSLLACAASLGEIFTFDKLCVAARNSMAAQEEQVLDSLEEALHAGLLTEESKNTSITYHFAPPILRIALQQRRPSLRRKRVVASILLVLLLASAGGWWLVQRAIPLPVQAQAISQFTAVFDHPDPAHHEVQARWLAARFPAQSVLLYAAGIIPAQRAVGQLLFFNEGTASVTLPSTTLIGKSGIPVTFNGPVTVPATSPLVAVVTGFTVQPGVSMLPAFDLDQACCAAGVFVKNAAFSPMTVAPPPAGIAPGTIEQAADVLSRTSVLNVTPQLAGMLQPNERAVDTSLSCVPQLTTIPTTRAVIVQVAVTCREVCYDAAQVASQAKALLAAQVARTRGPGYTLDGPLALHLVSATLDPDQQIILRVQVQGTWRSQEL